MGWVGSSTAISILQQGICSELLLNDVENNIAEGEAMDLNHASSYYPSAEVRGASVEEMMHCKAIVITAGRGGKPDESRLDLLKENLKILKDLSRKLITYKGILIIVTNPVDVLTYYYQKYTGLPPHRVIGTGTMLDTARLREMLGSQLNIDPKSVHAQVIGEHGDSEVVVWSKAVIGGVALRQWQDWSKGDEKQIGRKLTKAAHEIIKRKGATNHAIGMVTASLLACIFRNERRILNLSTLLTGQHGFEDLALSLPSVISEDGVAEVLEINLDEDEQQALQSSAEVLREAIRDAEN